jgi:hypothetical protein
VCRIEGALRQQPLQRVVAALDVADRVGGHVESSVGGLFHRDRFGQIARLVHIGSLDQGSMVGQ